MWVLILNSKFFIVIRCGFIVLQAKVIWNTWTGMFLSFSAFRLYNIPTVIIASIRRIIWIDLTVIFIVTTALLIVITVIIQPFVHVIFAGDRITIDCERPLVHRDLVIWYMKQYCGIHVCPNREVCCLRCRSPQMDHSTSQSVSWYSIQWRHRWSAWFKSDADRRWRFYSYRRYAILLVMLMNYDWLVFV